MPSGTAISVAAPVTSSVPRIAGPMPGPGRRSTSGSVFVKKSGKLANATEAPLLTSDHTLAASGSAISTNAPNISADIAALLAVRHVRRGRRPIARIGSPGCLIAAASLPPAPLDRALDDRIRDEVD